MKVTLEFDEHETKVAEQSFRGPEYACALDEFKEYLRGKRKYAGYESEAQQAIEDVEQAFYNIFGGLLDD